jgi:O-Antigen ligase
VLAMAFHTAVIVAGLGQAASYYDIGEQEGLAEGPHELALLGLVIAAGGLSSATRLPIRIAYVSIALVPALATGVRSALLAIAALFVLFMLKYRLNYRAVAVVAVVFGVAVVSGVNSIISERFRTEQVADSVLATAGSGRPSIWKVSLDRWAESGVDAWLFGTGLRSIKQFTLEELGGAFVGHSDIIEVGVQLGLVGLAGWLLIWLALMRARLETLVLTPIAVYSLTSGAMEYVAPLVVGLTLAAAYPRRDAPRSESWWLRAPWSQGEAAIDARRRE